MRVTVRLFGPQAVLAGQDELTVALSDAPTCAELRGAVAQAQPALAPSLPSSRFAVNHQYVGETHRIAAGDEVALIGMISGG